jgi:hypothetical protein
VKTLPAENRKPGVAGILESATGCATGSRCDVAALKRGTDWETCSTAHVFRTIFSPSIDTYEPAR